MPPPPRQPDPPHTSEHNKVSGPDYLSDVKDIRIEDNPNTNPNDHVASLLHRLYLSNYPDSRDQITRQVSHGILV